MFCKSVNVVYKYHDISLYIQFVRQTSGIRDRQFPYAASLIRLAIHVNAL